ncbi:hypothetical protein CC86DRAFT_167344 [Ophiobolus disseminans]|uniref:Secreted protein n=1 Tax=Ophiobolus disseminans TaxID=1469910 RepID=A0A6A7ADJ1_9PLEO|nr:hypothetical protein CC86DRAFT_167344 [Ophiobolus disseminans]
MTARWRLYTGSACAGWLLAAARYFEGLSVSGVEQPACACGADDAERRRCGNEPHQNTAQHQLLHQRPRLEQPHHHATLYIASPYSRYTTHRVERVNKPSHAPTLTGTSPSRSFLLLPH